MALNAVDDDAAAATTTHRPSMIDSATGLEHGAAELRLSAAQREVARLRQQMRLDNDSIEELQDAVAVLSSRLSQEEATTARLLPMCDFLESELRRERRRANESTTELAHQRARNEELQRRASEAEEALRAEVERGARAGVEATEAQKQASTAAGVAHDDEQRKSRRLQFELDEARAQVGRAEETHTREMGQIAVEARAQREAARAAEATAEALAARGDELLRQNERLRREVESLEAQRRRLQEAEAVAAHKLRAQAEAAALALDEASERLRAERREARALRRAARQAADDALVVPSWRRGCGGGGDGGCGGGGGDGSSTTVPASASASASGFGCVGGACAGVGFGATPSCLCAATPETMPRRVATESDDEEDDDDDLRDDFDHEDESQ